MNHILQVIILVMFSAMMIYYYYQLYLSTKSSRLILILEVGVRAILFILSFGKTGHGLLEYVLFVPVFLSAALYLTKGRVAKILFSILVAIVVVDVLFWMFDPYIKF